MALALWLCVHAIRLYTISPVLGDTYGVGYAVERFRTASAEIERGTVLGYVTDLPPDNPERFNIWATARYAMAPVVLNREATNTSLVLADLKRPAEAAQFLEREGFRVERDFGGGVLLLRRRP